MPPSQDTKELRQLWGHTWYYKTHINHYLGIIYTLTRLQRRTSYTYGPIINKEASESFKRYLQIPSIPIYSDPSISYFLLTGTTKYCRGAALYQLTSNTDILDSPKTIIFISGKLWDIKCLSEQFLQFICLLKRLSLYVQAAECTIVCDNHFQEKFLKGKRENNEVNN